MISILNCKLAQVPLRSRTRLLYLILKRAAAAAHAVCVHLSGRQLPPGFAPSSAPQSLSCSSRAHASWSALLLGYARAGAPAQMLLSLGRGRSCALRGASTCEPSVSSPSPSLPHQRPRPRVASHTSSSVSFQVRAQRALRHASVQRVCARGLAAAPAAPPPPPRAPPPASLLRACVIVRVAGL